LSSPTSFHLFGLKAAPPSRHFNVDMIHCGVHDWLLRLSADFLQEYEYSYHKEQVP